MQLYGLSVVELTVVLFEQFLYVEIEALDFEGVVLDGDVVEIGFDKDKFGGGESLPVDDVVLVGGVDDIPSGLGGLAVAGREYGLNEPFETVLPYVGLAVLAFLAQTVNEEIDLTQIEGYVGENLPGIFDNRVALRFGVYGLQIHLFDVFGNLDRAVGVVVLLAGISQVEMAELGQVHGGVVTEVLFEQVGVVVGGAAVPDGLFDFLHVGNLECGGLGGLELTAQAEEEYEEGGIKMFHRLRLSS